MPLQVNPAHIITRKAWKMQHKKTFLAAFTVYSAVVFPSLVQVNLLLLYKINQAADITSQTQQAGFPSTLLAPVECNQIIGLSSLVWQQIMWRWYWDNMAGNVWSWCWDHTPARSTCQSVRADRAIAIDLRHVGVIMREVAVWTVAMFGGGCFSWCRVYGRQTNNVSLDTKDMHRDIICGLKLINFSLNIHMVEWIPRKHKWR